MTREYKRPGLIRAGFDYQDLHAIELLINFYRDPDLYEWVEIDAEAADFRSIDDVVACRKDGIYDLLQVKFTPYPERAANELTWEWLTAAKPNGKSMLQKWSATALAHIQKKTLGTARLKTDRVPSEEFAKSLNDATVIVDLIPTSVKAQLISQIGSEADLLTFFANFQFLHSLPQIEEMETLLWERVAYDTDENGWYSFRKAVQRWGTEKNQPGPDGRIRHPHLVQVFATERPSKMPQGFEIPFDYQVPNGTFAETFSSRISKSDGLTVLWAPPGRGKSTFLSYCAMKRQKTTIFIRHHYHLSNRDRTPDRFHFNSIHWSLRTQLEQAVDGGATLGSSLSEAIQNAAAYLKTKRKRLAIIIDGVDHVWRENRSHEHLEQLFAELLPLPSNAHLIVGTQAIADEFLPSKLVAALPREDWHELPPMGFEAIRKWTTAQKKAKRLTLPQSYMSQAEHIANLAHAFHDITKGLPLHLIYTFEALLKSGEPTTEDRIRSLPSCPSGDIRDYYRGLWTRIGAKAKAVLHVLAGFDFGLPPGALPDCFGREDADFSAYTQFDHLLDTSELEVLPFHSSLFAYVRYLPDHKATFNANAKAVPAWLAHNAPEYWRWAWLWIASSMTGDNSLLLNGPTRGWAVESISKGYPVEQVTLVLEKAEYAAMSVFDLPKLLELRMIKTRVLNAPEFQTNEWVPFLKTTLAVADDEYLPAILRAKLPDFDPMFIGYLVRQADAGIKNSFWKKAVDELNSRLNAAAHDGHNAGQLQLQAARGLAVVVAHNPGVDLGRLLKFTAQFSDNVLKQIFARELRISHATGKLLELGAMDEDAGVRKEVFTHLCEEGIDIKAAQVLGKSDPNMVLLSLLQGDLSVRPGPAKTWDKLFVEDDDPMPATDYIKPALYDIFFRAFVANLIDVEQVETSSVPDAAQNTWLGDAVTQFEEAGQILAMQWKMGVGLPTLGEIYSLLEVPEIAGGNYSRQRQFIAARLAVRDIAIDLYLVGVALTPARLITADDIAEAAESKMWLDEIWLSEIVERHVKIHDSDAADAVHGRVISHLDSKIFLLNDRIDQTITLAAFDELHGRIYNTKASLQRASDYLLGYGWRKDTFAGEVLESLKEMIDAGDADAADVLISLASQFDQLSEYTEDGARYAKAGFYKAVVKVRPDLAPAAYADLIKREEWYYAETLLEEVSFPESTYDNSELALATTYLDGDLLRAHLSGSKTDAVGVAVQRLGTTREVVMRGDDERNETESASKSKPPIAIAPKDYPPGKLKEYWAADRTANGYSFDENLTTDWLNYWAESGKAVEALLDLEKSTFDGNSYMGSDRAFDGAFEIALKHQGRTAAYPWLVKAHDNRYGWLRFMTSEEESFRRMERLIAVYPTDWKQFILDTAESKNVLSERLNGLTIGFGRLVHFLVLAGQKTLAFECAMTMANMFIAETRSLPLPIMTWVK